MLSALVVLAAVLLVGKVLKPGFRQDVSVRVDMSAWHDRGLVVRSVELCMYVDHSAVCSARQRVGGVPPRVLTATLRLPEGPVRAEIRVEGTDAVQEAAHAVQVDPGVALELRAPTPP